MRDNVGRSAYWKQPHSLKSTMVAYGDFLLMISTSCLEKPPQKTLRLSHSSHSADGSFVPYLLKKSEGSKHNISFTPGVLKMTDWLDKQGHAVNCKRVPAPDAADRPGGHLCQTAIVQASASASYLSLPLAPV